MTEKRPQKELSFQNISVAALVERFQSRHIELNDREALGLGPSYHQAVGKLDADISDRTLGHVMEKILPGSCVDLSFPCAVFENMQNPMARFFGPNGRLDLTDEFELDGGVRQDRTILTRRIVVRADMACYRSFSGTFVVTGRLSTEKVVTGVGDWAIGWTEIKPEKVGFEVLMDAYKRDNPWLAVKNVLREQGKTNSGQVLTERTFSISGGGLFSYARRGEDIWVYTFLDTPMGRMSLGQPGTVARGRILCSAQPILAALGQVFPAAFKGRTFRVDRGFNDARLVHRLAQAHLARDYSTEHSR